MEPQALPEEAMERATDSDTPKQASVELLLQTCQLQIPLLILTLVASVLSGKVENKPW